MNKYTLLQKTPKSKKNMNLVSLQELKQKILKRKSQFMQHKKLQQKSKTPKQRDSLSPTFKNIPLTPEKNVRGSMTSRSPVRKVTQQPKHLQSLTDRPQNHQKRTKTVFILKDNDIQKPFPSSNNKTLESTIIWRKKQKISQQSNIQKTVETVAHNFLSSFTILFKELMEFYFVQMFLKRQTSHLASQIWFYVYRNTGLQSSLNKQIIQQSQIETKKFISAISNLLDQQFKKCQIQNMMAKYFPNKISLVFEDLKNLLTFQNDFIDFLIEKSFDKKYKSLSPTQLVNELFKSLIQSADIEKKLRMICRANENQLIKFVISISSGPMLKIPNLATFLDKNDREGSFGMKLTQAKVVRFLDKILSKKHTKYQFMKWLRIDDKLLR